MKTLLEKLIVNYPYVFAMVIFVIGTLTVLTKDNLFKKLIGINIMESSIFLVFIAASNIRDGVVPIISEDPHAVYINPLPSALMLTGIVVSVSVSAFALALIIRLYKTYGTTSTKRIAELRNEVSKDDSSDQS